METFDFGDGPVQAHQHPHGGGWVAESAKVWPTAYVGPQAQVFGEAHFFASTSKVMAELEARI